jgi:hypothetical protein
MTNQIQFSGNVPGQITILEGKALELKHPVKLQIDGDINAVTNFLSKRTGEFLGSGLQAVESQTTLIIIDEEAMTILLQLEPTNTFGTEIKASLKFTEDFLQWNINKPHQFTREQLVKLLRFGKRFFDPERHEEILKAYMALQVSANTEVKSASDTRGNKNNLFNKVVDSQHIPTEFVLNVQVFKGMATERFRVEICLEVTEGSVRFWFESPELVELIDRRKKEIFADITPHFGNYPVIYK